MAKSKNQKKIAFYKQRRKGTPGITDEQLRSMWKAKVEEELVAKKAKEDEKAKVVVESNPSPVVPAK